MNDALNRKAISDGPEQALLAAQFLVRPRRFWTDAPQSSFWTLRHRLKQAELLLRNFSAREF
jgi:hypothetical protein